MSEKQKTYFVAAEMNRADFPSLGAIKVVADSIDTAIAGEVAKLISDGWTGELHVFGAETEALDGPLEKHRQTHEELYNHYYDRFDYPWNRDGAIWSLLTLGGAQKTATVAI